MGWQNFVTRMDQDRSSAPEALWTRLRTRISEQCGPSLEDDCTLITLDILK